MPTIPKSVVEALKSESKGSGRGSECERKERVRRNGRKLGVTMVFFFFFFGLRLLFVRLPEVLFQSVGHWGAMFTELNVRYPDGCMHRFGALSPIPLGISFHSARFVVRRWSL